MSHRTLPLLYLNLAGEMMYIIDDRLMHQKIPPERAVKGKLKKKFYIFGREMVNLRIKIIFFQFLRISFEKITIHTEILTHEKIPQNNFSHQYFSVEHIYFHLM